MDLPPSSLLSRLQAFLPEMEKANRATEQLAAEGKLSAIDSNLEIATTPDGEQAREGEDCTDEEDDDEDNPAAPESEVSDTGSSGQVVQLDFALGDFDDTPIAQMEQDGEARAAQGNATGESCNANSDADQEEDVEEDGRIAALQRAQHSDSKAPTQDGHKQKPLIEEL